MSKEWSGTRLNLNPNHPQNWMQSQEYTSRLNGYYPKEFPISERDDLKHIHVQQNIDYITIHLTIQTCAIFDAWLKLNDLLFVRYEILYMVHRTLNYTTKQDGNCRLKQHTCRWEQLFDGWLHNPEYHINMCTYLYIRAARYINIEVSFLKCICNIAFLVNTVIPYNAIHVLSAFFLQKVINQYM